MSEMHEAVSKKPLFQRFLIQPSLFETNGNVGRMGHTPPRLASRSHWGIHYKYLRNVRLPYGANTGLGFMACGVWHE
ncbi:MAG: hypothetical protein LBB84_12095 [Tannerellaceae bacterium]|nr:hypothetical protein [Tannerellaceae bacterium]